MKYIAQHLGLNIRPCKSLFVEEEGLWKVPLKAIVPRRVTKRDREAKVFIYHLDQVGHLLYEKTDKIFVLISPPSSSEIESEIAQRFADLTECIERELLKEGERNWGKLAWLKTFLRPMYSIVINILPQKKISVEALVQEGNWEFAKFLIEEEYIKIAEERKSCLIPTNKLTRIWEELYAGSARAFEETSSVLQTTAEIVVGKVFANQYSKIKTDLRINSPTAYVDATKVYYIDAIRFGENIPISENELFFEYQKIGARTFRSKTSLPGFRTLLSELASVELLVKRGSYVLGRQRIFDNLMEYRDEVLQGAVESPGVAKIG